MSQAAERPAPAPFPADQFPAQAMHVCQVLARMLQRVPRPESVQLFTADHWSSPWLQVHLYPDPDDEQLTAYQQTYGGRLTRSRREGDARSVVYSELATVVDRVRVQVWNVNEAPSPSPSPSPSPTPVPTPSPTASATPEAPEETPAAAPADLPAPAEVREPADVPEPADAP